MGRPKVLIIQDLIPHYRVPVFNELSKYVELTVVCSGGNVPENAEFNAVKVDAAKFLKIFNVHKGTYKIAKNQDVIISMLSSNCFETMALCCLKHRKKSILWGIGVSAGYACKYDENPKAAKVMRRMIKRSKAALFYSDYPVEKYSKTGIKKEKMFVANNTVAVSPIQGDVEKDSILFVGSLYKAKKIFELLENYYEAYKVNKDINELVVVGDGDEFENVKSWITEHKMESKITLTGAIFDDEILKDYFARALICVSPDQAGLSVLKSMGYGVPFITHKDAITGGERFNIKNGENGVLFDDFSELKDLFVNLAQEKEKYIEMGKKAKEHYDNNRTVPQMAEGFLDAIDYVLKCNKKSPVDRV